MVLVTYGTLAVAYRHGDLSFTYPIGSLLQPLGQTLYLFVSIVPFGN